MITAKINKTNILSLFIYFTILFPIISSAQDQNTLTQNRPTSGYDPYVFITLSPDAWLGTQVVTKITVGTPFYIGVRLPPLLARHKDFSTDYAIDLTIFRPDGKALLHKDQYHTSKEKIYEKSVLKFVDPMLMLCFDQNQTKGRYRIQVELHDLIAAITTDSSCTLELK
jgi:hypothetical protein